MTLSELPTPCLVLDRARLENNLQRMSARMREHDVTLRPHVKTAKSLEIARLIFDGRTGPITVSTLREAEYFCAGGFNDILYAVGIVPGRLQRAKALLDAGCELKLVLDDASVAAEVATAGVDFGATFEVLIEIDSDGHRAGLEPDDPAVIEIARLLDARAGVEFGGFMTHAGGAYDCRGPDEIRRHAAREVEAVVHCAGGAAAAGLAVPLISVGSTPTATLVEDLSGIDEVRAGVYVFQDLYQAGLGVCRIDDIALSVLATVIGHRRGRNWLIVDSGALALSKDRSTARQAVDCGYGLVCTADGEIVPDLRVESLDQEHGRITSAAGALDFARFPIGARVRILPNHSCITAAAHDDYHVLEGDRITAAWPRCRGW